jgi:hypothetical protein
MNRQNSKKSKQKISIETAPYHIMEMNSKFNNVVLEQISIAILNCCRTVVLKYRFIPVKKQLNTVVKN